MIVTLTLNPAFDVHVGLHEFRVGHENTAAAVSRDIGGKGINISRALLENRVDNAAIVVLGEENAADFRNGIAGAVSGDGAVLCCEEITVAGRIRENITVHPEIGDETRLSFAGFSTDDSLFDRTSTLLQKIGVQKGDIVTFTGSLPKGVTLQAAEDFLMTLRQRGIRLVIDSKSVPTDMLMRIRPWLIKPNREEIEACTGAKTTSEILDAAERLHQSGIENVMVSLGADGAVLCCADGTVSVKAKKIHAVSTIGAGDSMIAGFIAGSVHGESPVEALRTAVAYGTAACLREGTNPPLPTDIISCKNF